MGLMLTSRDYANSLETWEGLVLELFVVWVNVFTFLECYNLATWSLCFTDMAAANYVTSYCTCTNMSPTSCLHVATKLVWWSWLANFIGSMGPTCSFYTLQVGPMSLPILQLMLSSTYYCQGVTEGGTCQRGKKQLHIPKSRVISLDGDKHTMRMVW